MLKIERDARGRDWSTRRWFNVGSPCFWIRGLTARPILVWLWDCFNRHTADGDHYWGVGLLNINGRHLVYIGHEKADLFFARVWRRRSR